MHDISITNSSKDSLKSTNEETKMVRNRNHSLLDENETKTILHTPAKRYTTGMGQAVADRTINRKVTHKLKQPEI